VSPRRRRRPWRAAASADPSGEPGSAGGRGWRGWALTGAAGLATLVALHAWVPPEGTRFAFCPLRRFAGLPCPACGLTRAFAHLAKGEWSAAVRDHPLAPVLAAELGLAWAAWGCALAGLLRPAERAGAFRGVPASHPGEPAMAAGSGAGRPALRGMPQVHRGHAAAAATASRFLELSRPDLAALGHLAVMVAVWLGRAATGTLPW
jgi:hypothetical protein